MTDRKVCVGVVIGAKGVRGEVRIKSFTDSPRDVGAYGPVTTEDGREFDVKVAGAVKDVVTARLNGVGDRDAAEALKGVELYVARAAMPPPEEGRYYHTDLVGLAAKLTTGEDLGTVSAVHNYGAGDILEVKRPEGETEFIPFTPAAIAAVDVAGGTVTITPLPGLFDDGSSPEDT